MRGAVKLKLFLAVTTVLALALFATAPVLRLLGRRRAASRCSAALFRRWARWSSRTMGIRLEIRGDPPRPPFLLVANHLGYVDVLVLGSVLDCVFVSRADVAGWPLAGVLVRAVGTIFIDRETKRDIPRAVARIEELVQHGRGVVFFPEGTSSAGAGVLPFKPSLLEAAVRSGMPVSFATLTYHTAPGIPPAAERVCWWGDMPFVPHVLRLLRLPGFAARVTFGSGTLEETDRKELAVRARRAVLAQFEPVTGATGYNDALAPRGASG